MILMESEARFTHALQKSCFMARIHLSPNTSLLTNYFLVAASPPYVFSHPPMPLLHTLEDVTSDRRLCMGSPRALPTAEY